MLSPPLLQLPFPTHFATLPVCQFASLPARSPTAAPILPEPGDISPAPDRRWRCRQKRMKNTPTHGQLQFN